MMAALGTARSIAVDGYISPIDVLSLATDGLLIGQITPPEPQIRYTCPAFLRAYVLDSPRVSEAIWTVQATTYSLERPTIRLAAVTGVECSNYLQDIPTLRGLCCRG